MLTSNGYVLDERRLGELATTPRDTDLPVLRGRLREEGYLLFRRLLDPQNVLDFRRYYFDLTGAATDRASSGRPRKLITTWSTCVAAATRCCRPGSHWATVRSAVAD